MAVGYNQELYNLIDEPDDSNIKESGVGKCALASFALIEAHFKNLGTQIDQVARDGQLKATMREVRTVLLNVEKVARTFKDLKIIGQQDDVVRAMRRACEIYNPKDLLHTLSGISSRYPGLFQELAEGTGYSETKFYQLASGILVEAEMAGVLAMKCILWAESPVSETLKQRYEIEITEYINETEIELMKAGGNLRQNFSTIVQNDMQSFLKYTTENHLNTQQVRHKVDQAIFIRCLGG
uniref:Uncharacterized protein n=1 Tax=Plectus sambesii TaxID=2011161 RepID=A0A914WJR2_9BILA